MIQHLSLVRQFLFRCTFSMFKGEVLQSTTHLILLRNQQDVIIEL